MKVLTFEIPDDSGFLAVVDPDAYETFVSEEWTFALLEPHFVAQMAAKRLLLWDTSRPDIWEVSVSLGSLGARGLREATGPIVATRGRLLSASFGSLSMAAQFADVTQPEPHEQDQVLAVSPGEYRCRVVQHANIYPFVERTDQEGVTDFVIEIVQGDGSLPPWRSIPWWRRDLFVD